MRLACAFVVARASRLRLIRKYIKVNIASQTTTKRFFIKKTMMPLKAIALPSPRDHGFRPVKLFHGGFWKVETFLKSLCFATPFQLARIEDFRNAVHRRTAFQFVNHRVNTFTEGLFTAHEFWIDDDERVACIGIHARLRVP